MCKNNWIIEQLILWNAHEPVFQFDLPYEYTHFILFLLKFFSIYKVFLKPLIFASLDSDFRCFFFKFN